MHEKLRIVYHFRVRGTGAEGVHIAGIVNGFRKLGHSVRLISPTKIDPTGESPDSKENVQFKHSIFSFLLHTLADSLPEPFFEIMELFYNAFAIPRLRKAIIDERADFIYERYAFYNFSGALLASLMKIPLVVEVNELSGHKRVRRQCFVKLARSVEKFIFKRAALIITVSDFLKDEITKMVGFKKQIVTISNGVPQNWLEKQPSIQEIEYLRQKYNLSEKKVICFIGALVYWHNFDLLLEVINSLQVDVPETVLLIVGDGPMKEYIATKVQKMDLYNDSVLLVGSVPHYEIPLYISLADVAIIPETNSFRSPIKMFEYMALAKPVVAPRMPAIQAVIEDGKDGLLFEPGSHSDIRDALLQLLTTSSQAEAIGRLARNKIACRFTWEIHAKLILSLIDPLLVI